MLGEIIKRIVPTYPHELFASLKALQHFGHTSRRMYSVIHSDYVSTLVIDAILNRHNALPRHLFRRLGIPSLRRYIRNNGLDRAFGMLPTMHSVLAESIRSAAPVLRNNCFVLSQSKNFLTQPKSFLLLFNPYIASRIIQLIHPFGRIVISARNQIDPEDLTVDAVSIFDAVINRLNASFEGVFRTKGARSGNFKLVEVKSNCNYFRVRPSWQKDKQIRRILEIESDIELISQKDYEDKKGEQVLVFPGPYFSFSCYKLERVFGHFLSRNQCRDDRLMHIISDMLYFESSVNAHSSIYDEDERRKWMDIHLSKTIADMLEDPAVKVCPFLFLKEHEEEDANAGEEFGYLL